MKRFCLFFQEWTVAKKSSTKEQEPVYHSKSLSLVTVKHQGYFYNLVYLWKIFDCTCTYIHIIEWINILYKNQTILYDNFKSDTDTIWPLSPICQTHIMTLDASYRVDGLKTSNFKQDNTTTNLLNTNIFFDYLHFLNF